MFCFFFLQISLLNLLDHLKLLIDFTFELFFRSNCLVELDLLLLLVKVLSFSVGAILLQTDDLIQLLVVNQ